MALRLRPITTGLLAALLAGCSSYSSQSAFTLPTLSAFNLPQFASPSDDGAKGTVLLSANIAGLTCAESRVVLARADATGFATAGVFPINSQFGNGSGGAVIDLPSGIYHIVHVACRNGSKVVSAGVNPYKEAVPWKSDHWESSLASFELAPGDVLDVGELSVTLAKVDGFSSGIDGRAAAFAVKPSDPHALAELIRQRPDDAPRLHTAAMTLKSAGAQTISKCRLVAPKVRLATDGSSKVPELLADHPQAKPVFDMIAGGTKDADGCVPEKAGLPASLTPDTIAAAAAKVK